MSGRWQDKTRGGAVHFQFDPDFRCAVCAEVRWCVCVHFTNVDLRVSFPICAHCIQDLNERMMDHLDRYGEKP